MTLIATQDVVVYETDLWRNTTEVVKGDDLMEANFYLARC
jgi:hypothetical protein